jgi:hypothetical protein
MIDCAQVLLSEQMLQPCYVLGCLKCREMICSDFAFLSGIMSIYVRTASMKF